VAQALMGLASREPIAVIGIPMQAGERVDQAVIGRVARRIADNVPSLVLKAPLATDELIATLGSLDLLVSMRLHACLLAHRLGCPVVGIAYDPKVANHFSELGRSHACVTLPLQGPALEEALASVAAETNGLPVQVRERIHLLEAEAVEALSGMARQLAQGPTRMAVFEVPRFETQAPVAVVPKQPPASATATPASVRPAPPGAAGPPVVARFDGISHVCSGSIRLPDGTPVTANPRAWLPTQTPTKGDGMEASGILEIQGDGDVEVSLVLVSPYENPKALNRVRCILEMGDRWRLVEDLAVAAAPIQLRLFTTAPARIPLRLSLYVTRTAFASSAWPRVSPVELRLASASRSAHGCDLKVVASRGDLQALAPLDLALSK
jgi:hypothetical protein